MKTFAEFLDIKYNDLDEWIQGKRANRLLGRIDGNNEYSLEYKAKLKDAYRFFKQHDFELTEHALNRVVGQKTGKGKRQFTKEEALGIMRKSANYAEGETRIVKYYDGIAVIQGLDTGEVISVVVREKKPTWRVLDGSK